MEPYARAYYAAKILNVLDQVHTPIFEAIHLKKKSVKNEADFAQIFAANGVDSEKFSSAFNSFGTNKHGELRQNQGFVPIRFAEHQK